MEPLWFPRFADIPGVTYAPSTQIDPSSLPGRGQRPEISRYSGIAPSLRWGNTSASPAKQFTPWNPPIESTEQLLVRIAQVLELPGEPSDYHFAIQSTAGALRSRTARAPALFDELERLCWLDLQLIQAVPEAVSVGEPEGERYFSILTITWLLQLYLREGQLLYAAQVASIAERFGQKGEMRQITIARERYAAVQAEDAAG